MRFSHIGSSSHMPKTLTGEIMKNSTLLLSIALALLLAITGTIFSQAGSLHGWVNSNTYMLTITGEASEDVQGRKNRKIDANLNARENAYKKFKEICPDFPGDVASIAKFYWTKYDANDAATIKVHFYSKGLKEKCGEPLPAKDEERKEEEKEEETKPADGDSSQKPDNWVDEPHVVRYPDGKGKVYSKPTGELKPRNLPVKNFYQGSEGCYVECVSDKFDGAAYYAKPDSDTSHYVFGWVRLEGKYINKSCQPKGIETDDLSKLDSMKKLCETHIPNCGSKCTGYGRTGEWFP